MDNYSGPYLAAVLAFRDQQMLEGKLYIEAKDSIQERPKADGKLQWEKFMARAEKGEIKLKKAYSKQQEIPELQVFNPDEQIHNYFGANLYNPAKAMEKLNEN